MSAAMRSRRPLAIVLVLGVSVLVVQLIGAVLSGSLALLADAVHVFADVMGVASALLAVTIAARPTQPKRTFGLFRLEVLVATGNCFLLLALSAFILWQGIQRWLTPVDVTPSIMIVAALYGVVANGVGLLLLRRGAGESLTVKGAYLEVLSDTLASAGVVVAAVVIVATGWMQADAVVSIAIALFMVPRTLILLRASLSVLLETAPRDLDLEEVRRALLDVDGVTAVHDLHAWVITSGMASLSAHVEVSDAAFRQDLGAAMLAELRQRAQDRFDIVHTTFQLECTAYSAVEPPSHP
ncbi:MAG: cation diffusion facilitator family transporter [Actinomycetota bacterium]|nr:cation diffusion facilitator family transporter [Actinomycetota bacterium]